MGLNDTKISFVIGEEKYFKMNRKIILLPLSFAAILALAACNPTKAASSSSDGGAIVPDTSSTSTATSSSTPAVAATAAERHAAYLAAVNGTEEKTVTIQGVLMGYEHYSGNTAYNAYFQEDIYGYWVNNFVLPEGGKIGDSFSIVGKTYYGDKAKAYPCLKYSSATKLTTSLTANRLTLGATGNDFAKSLHAGITTGEVALTEVNETSGVWKFVIGSTTYSVTHNTNVAESDAIAAKMKGIGVGRKVTFKGYWGSTLAATMLATNVSVTSADDITVNPTLPDATAVAVSGADSIQSVKTGSTVTPATYTAVVTPSGAAQTVTWSVKAEDGVAETTAATISAEGVLTPAFDIASDTKVTVVATSATAGIAGTKQVSVLAVPKTLVETITISGTATVEVGATTQLTAAVAPEGASTAVVWSSSNVGVATVDTNGLVTGVADGPVTITATATDGSKKTGTYAVTVTNAKVKTWTEIYTAVKDLANSAASAEFIFKGVIVAWVDGTAKTFLVSDGTNAVEVYQAAATKCYDGMAVGDYVEVDSTFQHYYNLIETKGLVSITKAASDDKPAVPTAATTDATAFDALASDATTYLTGKYLSISSAQINASGTKEVMTIHGATGTANVSAVNGFTLPADGVWGTFKAWVVSGNSSSKTLTVWVDGFTADAAADPTAITVTAAGNATSVNAGSTLKFSATAAPWNASSTVTWAVKAENGTDNTTLATIDADGLLTAGSTAGKVTVIATSTVKATIVSTPYALTINAVEGTSYNIATVASSFKDSSGTAISNTYGDFSYTATDGTIFETTYGNNSACTSGTAWASSTVVVAATCAKGATDVAPAYFNITSTTAFTKVSFTAQNWNTDTTTVNLEYSTDGSTWTADATAAVSSTSNASAINMASSSTFSVKYARIKVTTTVSSAPTSAKKYRIGVFDVTLKA
jgi:hypothetical protein